MDKKIVSELYNFTLKYNSFCSFIKFVVSLSASLFFIAFTIAAAFLLFTGDSRFFKFCFIPAVTIFFNMFLRKIVGRKRPFHTLGFQSIVQHKSISSFPSNHSASAMIIAFAFLYLNYIIGSIVFLFAIITGFARIFAGLHYLSDVLAGFFIAIIFGYMGFFL